MLDWMIERLKQENPGRIIRYGFSYNSHSQSPFCNKAWLTPKRNVRVKTLIKVLIKAREESTDKGRFSIDCWLTYSNGMVWGEEITTYMFEAMLSGNCTCFARCRLDYERGTHGIFPESHKPDYVLPEEAIEFGVRKLSKRI